MYSIIKASLSLLLFGAITAHAKTGVDILKGSSAPVFKEGHTLLPLTRFAWPLSVELNVELAERWGYALDIDPGPLGADLDKPTSPASMMVTIAKANPARYPVSVNTRRVMFEDNTVQGLLSADAWCRDASGSLIMRGGLPVMKPFISDADAAAIGNSEVARLKRLKDLGITASVVLNGAEYMPHVPGHEGTDWRKDPEVGAWLDSNGSLTPDGRVAAFAAPKAKQEQAVRDAVLSVMPGTQVVYYVTGDTRRGIVPEENRLPWTWPYRFMIKGGTIPSWQFYYPGDGRWVPGTKIYDPIPVLMTNSIAQGIEDGRPLSYNYVSAGWSLTNPDLVSDDARYMGFLKYLYTLGSVGNVAGYFSNPQGGFNGDLGASTPDWLRQIMLLSHAHATFSHLEHYLRQGDLLPGDGSHFFSVDLYGKPSWPHPSYEFDTNEKSPNARVAARRLKDKPDWLIVAWAADGNERNVSVQIPELGEVTLLARPEGSVYRALPGASPVLLDPVGMDPSRKVTDILSQMTARKPSPPLDVRVD